MGKLYITCAILFLGIWRVIGYTVFDSSFLPLDKEAVLFDGIFVLGIIQIYLMMYIGEKYGK